MSTNVITVYDINRVRPPKAPARDDVQDPHFVPAPCQVACPVGTDAPSYIGYIWEEKFAEAFEAITATNPFSSICGRVCDAPCEPACRRTENTRAPNHRIKPTNHQDKQLRNKSNVIN